MSFVAAGVVAGGAIVGSVIQAGAAESAANTQAQSAANAQAISQQQYQDTVNRNAPFTQSGYGALSQLDYLLGVGPQDAQGNPVYGGSTGGGNGTDPNSGYHIGAGGQISQRIPGGTGATPIQNPLGGSTGMSRAPIPAGTSGLPGSVSRMQPQPFGGAANGLGYTAPSAGYNGPIGGSGLPIGSGGLQGPGLPNNLPNPTQTATAGGYGSLLKPFDISDWQSLSPAYNFQRQQGQQGVLNASASGQGALSGAAYKDLIDYNQNEANTSFNNAFNQYQTQQGNVYSRLAGIAQMGQASANNTGQQGTALAGQAAQAAVAQGSYSAAGTVGAANAISGGISGAAPWLQAGAGGSGPDTAWIGSQANNVIDNTNWNDPSLYSDRRLKTDVQRVGMSDNGLPIYRFKYIHSNKVHIGFMADEVEQICPEAVSTDPDGFKMVDYGRAG